MKKVLVVLFLFTFSWNAYAVDVAGVNVPSDVEISGEKLQLNGYGIRKKFVFVKVYVGSLFTGQKATTTANVMTLPGNKLIRMDFLYKKVEKKKIIDAFAEGFEKNSPELVATPAARQFLGLFTNDFIAGDQVDLIMTTDGTVSASHNGKALGTVKSADLVKAVLLIYLGDYPADADMKAGMLGGN